jgi:hemerythrin
MSVSWKNEFSIGVDEIDRQHQQMFHRFDLFLEAVDQGKGERELEEVLKFLDEYVLNHFKTEEELQKRFNYPHQEMHAAEHRLFEKQLQALTQHKGSKGELVNLTRNVLMHWLIGHICKIDSALGGFINKHRDEVWDEWLKGHFSV